MKKRPFIPNNLPIKNLQWDKLTKLVGEANYYLSRYNEVLTLNNINPDLVLTSFALKEATLSTQIEGAIASFTEALQKNSANKILELDIEEIENCKKAMDYAIQEFKNHFPLCLRLIKEMHSILLNSARGSNKDRGNFRRVQNFIGPTARMEDATYIPPDVITMEKAIKEWEEYIHLESEEILIQLAVIHAQFEIIHPFLDGNGRIGRILIPLFLYYKKYLEYPAFYMSEFLEDNRKKYYSKLKDISENDNWQGWIEFFLYGVIEQSKTSYERVKNILALYKDVQNNLPNITKSKYSSKIMDIIFKKPIVKVSDVKDEVKLSSRQISNILDKLSNPVNEWLEEKVEKDLFESKKSFSKVKKSKQILRKVEGSRKEKDYYEFIDLLKIIENKI
jgi:Fic family protein